MGRARTLDGNSFDWRYANVRRTMIMLEQSCRLALMAMVFEPNVAATWFTIKSMLQNFLTSVWNRGGLVGAAPAEEFSVDVGLGETMTPDDILEGILRVSVPVSVTQQPPAEAGGLVSCGLKVRIRVVFCHRLSGALRTRSKSL